MYTDTLYIIQYISLKNYRPLYEARALVVNMCAGLLSRPNFCVSTISLYGYCIKCAQNEIFLATINDLHFVHSLRTEKCGIFCIHILLIVIEMFRCAGWTVQMYRSVLRLVRSNSTLDRLT